MSTATVIDYLSRISIFQGYGPGWFLGALFLLGLPKTLRAVGDLLRGAAEMIRALAKLKAVK
jgi:hypothetical protein